MLELYSAPQSTCSQKVRLTLAEKNLDFVEHKMKLFQNDQLKPEYLKLNEPKQRAHMRAWLRFFEEVPTVAVRFPSYNAAFARHFEKMSDEEFKALAKSKPLRDKFLGEMDKQKGFSIEKLKQAEDSISKTVKRMENPLSRSEYLLGKNLTLADFAILPSMIRMEDLGYEFLWKDCPGVAAWMVRMKNRRSYSAAYYEGSLLSQQYTGIREEHQGRRALALADSAA